MLEMSSSEACVGRVAFALKTGFFLKSKYLLFRNNRLAVHAYVYHTPKYQCRRCTSVADSDPMLFLPLDWALADPGYEIRIRDSESGKDFPEPVFNPQSSDSLLKYFWSQKYFNSLSTDSHIILYLQYSRNL
jgi:hypothetical protein